MTSKNLFLIRKKLFSNRKKRLDSSKQEGFIGASSVVPSTHPLKKWTIHTVGSRFSAFTPIIPSSTISPPTRW